MSSFFSNVSNSNRLIRRSLFQISKTVKQLPQQSQCKQYTQTRFLSQNTQRNTQKNNNTTHSTNTHTTLQNVYSAKVADGILNFDENQFKLIKLLNKMSIYLVQNENENKTMIQLVAVADSSVIDESNKNSSIIDNISDSNLASPTSKIETKIVTNTEIKTEISPTPQILRARGLYIYGSVGIGKTIVMDLFYNYCDIERKKRVHFHQFMLDIHHRIHLYKLQVIYCCIAVLHVSRTMYVLFVLYVLS